MKLRNVVPAGKRALTIAATSCALMFANVTIVSAQAVDWSRYCSAAGKNVLLLVDITTPYDTQDKKILVDGLQSIVAQFGNGDRIVIRTIADSFAHSERLIEVCVPYCPPQSFWEELFSSCTGGLILNHKRAMIGQIREVVRERLNRFSELNYSEIIGTITHAAKEELRPNQTSEMYLFSDMIENSENLPGKVFSTEPNIELLNKIESDVLLPSLSGVNVRVFGVGRGGGEARVTLPVQKLNKLVEFWNMFFDRAGASNVSISQNLIDE